MTQKDTKKTYLTIRQFTDRYTFLSADALRWQIKRNKEFEKACVRRFGRKVLLDEENVLKFIDKTPYKKEI